MLLAVVVLGLVAAGPPSVRTAALLGALLAIALDVEATSRAHCRLSRCSWLGFGPSASGGCVRLHSPLPRALASFSPST